MKPCGWARLSRSVAFIPGSAKSSAGSVVGTKRLDVLGCQLRAVDMGESDKNRDATPDELCEPI